MEPVIRFAFLVLCLFAARVALADTGSAADVLVASISPGLSEAELASLADMSRMPAGKSTAPELFDPLAESERHTEELRLIAEEQAHAAQRLSAMQGWFGGAFYMAPGVNNTVTLVPVDPRTRAIVFDRARAPEQWTIEATWCLTHRCVFALPLAVSPLYSHLVVELSGGRRSKVWLYADRERTYGRCELSVPADTTNEQFGYYRSFLRESTDLHACGL